MSELPSFLQNKAPRGVLAERWDRAKKQTHKVEKFKTEPSENLRLNSQVITSDKVKEIGEQALEQASWPLKSTPYAVQAYALNLGCDAMGFNYFLEQGLGKTRTTLADFYNRYSAGLNDSMVVVTINSMKLVWKKEMEEEAYPFDIHIWPDVKDFPDSAKGQVIVINYEAIRGRGLKWLLDLMMNARTFLVFDESTCIANHTSQQGKAGIMLSGMATSVRNLAGLPNPNGPADFYNQLKATKVPIRMPPAAFRNRYSEMGGYKGKQVIGTRNEECLARLIKGRAVFADKMTWAPTLPKRLYSSRRVEMTPAQKKAYHTMLTELYAEVEGGQISIEQAVNKGCKLQQIAAGYLYNTEEKTVHTIGNGENPKLDCVKEYLKHADGKTLVFGFYKHSVKQLIKGIPGCAYALSKVEMKDAELEAQKDRFNNDPECRVFVAPISVMQFGHTLVGTPRDPCTSTLYYENSYSRLYRSQSQDRNHRWGAVEGEDAAILYCDIICSPIDERAIEVLRGKGEMAQSLLSVIKGVLYGK